MQTATQLRSRYLKFFEGQNHRVFPSFSLIPAGDPSLLFTSAGMVPFKAYFLGLKKDVSRATSSQRCFRTTDIDRVGTTVRHLTFFEMLGNFSFGDYFKKEAIAWAWKFLTEEVQLDPKRLHITVFQDDEEAENFWKAHKPVNPIVRLGEETNFWNMGPTGPCGPCSEIYFDRGAEYSCGKPTCGVGCDCDRYFEVWNLVFTQFDRQEDGSLKNLPRTNIDTGMGLERLAMVVQGKKSTFETDLFWPIMEEASGIIGKLPGMTPDTKLAFRVIGDHTRASIMLIPEGIVPSNEGRGYVLRRLIRRAVRYGRLHGVKGAFVHKLVPAALSIYKGVYDEPGEHKKAIVDTIRNEEERFLETLETGEKILTGLLERYAKSIPGDEAFKLYDTYGFPLELTREIAAQKGVHVDDVGFETARLAAQRTARAGWKGSGERAVTGYQALAEQLPNTRFIGYDTLKSASTVLAIMNEEGHLVKEISGAKTEVEVVLDQTPFYAEGGGQVGDKGALVDPKGKARLEVFDTQSPLPGLNVHKARLDGRIAVGTVLEAEVDRKHRVPTGAHHTATHLLNEALRRILGLQVRQAGSLVAPDHLRFDFTTPHAPSPDELKKAEEMVNAAIAEDLVVDPEIKSMEEARLAGAVALLGEKYSDRPRCVLISPKGWEQGGFDPHQRFSLELCGGTHVSRTGEIRLFRVLKESSVSAGTRRIEAVAGPAAVTYFREIEETTRAISSKLGVAPEKLESKVEALLREIRDLKGEIGGLKHKLLAGDSGGKKRREGKLFLLETFADMDVDIGYLRGRVDEMKKAVPSGILVAAASKEGKVSFVVGMTEDLQSKGIDAGKVAKAIAVKLAGSAGGRKDFAQGGGKVLPDWEAAIEQVLTTTSPS